MEFKITHITTYKYGNAAAEAYGEARLTPPDLPTQKVLKHRVSIEPPTRTSRYVDHFGNCVDFFSLPFRHQKLVVSSHVLVETTPPHAARGEPAGSRAGGAADFLLRAAGRLRVSPADRHREDRETRLSNGREGTCGADCTLDRG